LLAEKPRTADGLAAKTETHAPSLYRVLRTLASAGVFAETADQQFELTPIAALRREVPPNAEAGLHIRLTTGGNPILEHSGRND